MRVKAKSPAVFTHPLKAAITNKLNADALSKDVTFDEIRTALGKDKDKLPDGTIYQVAIDAGFKVETS